MRLCTNSEDESRTTADRTSPMLTFQDRLSDQYSSDWDEQTFIAGENKSIANTAW